MPSVSQMSRYKCYLLSILFLLRFHAMTLNDLEQTFKVTKTDGHVSVDAETLCTN